MSKPKTAAYKVADVKRSKTGNNPCQCLVPMGDDYIDAEMVELGYSPETHRFFRLGCGAHCSNRFAQGHDAKLKSELIRAFRDGVEMAIDTGGMLVGTDAMNMAKQLGWGHFLTPAKAKTPRKAKGPKALVLREWLDDEIGTQIFAGSSVEFKYRGKQQQATVAELGMDDATVFVTWANSKGEKSFTVEAARCTVIA